MESERVTPAEQFRIAVSTAYEDHPIRRAGKPTGCAWRLKRIEVGSNSSRIRRDGDPSTYRYDGLRRGVWADPIESRNNGSTFVQEVCAITRSIAAITRKLSGYHPIGVRLSPETRRPIDRPIEVDHSGPRSRDRSALVRHSDVKWRGPPRLSHSGPTDVSRRSRVVSVVVRVVSDGSLELASRSRSVRAVLRWSDAVAIVPAGVLTDPIRLRGYSCEPLSGVLQDAPAAVEASIAPWKFPHGRWDFAGSSVWLSAGTEGVRPSLRRKFLPLVPCQSGVPDSTHHFATAFPPCHRSVLVVAIDSVGATSVLANDRSRRRSALEVVLDPRQFSETRT